MFVGTFEQTSLEFFLNCTFSRASVKADKNQRERSLILQYSFAQKTRLILQTSTYSTLKISSFRNTTKNLSHFKNVLEDTFLVAVRKNICTARFLDAQELHSRSILKANGCLPPSETYCSRDVVRLLSGQGGRGRLANFLKAALIGPRKMF